MANARAAAKVRAAHPSIADCLEVGRVYRALRFQIAAFATVSAAGAI